jgi:REP element-mobilizing transposase RayT
MDLNKMILAFHSIFSMYGFWMPNDPRGSGSDYVAVWELFRYGRATKVRTRHSVAAKQHDHKMRLAAKQALRHPPADITGVQAVAVVEGFRKACDESGYFIHACAVLPEHIHLVIGWHRRDIRKIVGHLKSNATRRLKDSGQWTFGNRTMWGEHGWNVYLYNIPAVKRAIRYVEANPEKEGKKRQSWSIVTPFEVAAAQSASQATRLNSRKASPI